MIATDEISKAIVAVSDSATEIEDRETINQEIVNYVTNDLLSKVEVIEALNNAIAHLNGELNKYDTEQRRNLLYFYCEFLYLEFMNGNIAYVF